MSALSLPLEDANRARESAWDRYQEARRDHNALARVVARAVARGRASSVETLGDDLILAQAAEFEARADWTEARECWQALRMDAA